MKKAIAIIAMLILSVSAYAQSYTWTNADVIQLFADCGSTTPTETWTITEDVITSKIITPLMPTNEDYVKNFTLAVVPMTRTNVNGITKAYVAWANLTDSSYQDIEDVLANPKFKVAKRLIDNNKLTTESFILDHNMIVNEEMMDALEKSLKRTARRLEKLNARKIKLD